MNIAGTAKHCSSRLLFMISAGCIAWSGADAGEALWEGAFTPVYQDTDDKRADAELTASADLLATLKRPRGEWLLHIEASSSPNSNGVSAYYPAANGDAGSVLSAGGDGGVQVSEFNYTFFMDGNRSLMLGLIDPSAWLGQGRIANDENNDFLNGSFVNIATIAFPDYTLGGMFRLTGNNQWPDITVLISGSDGIADTPDRSIQDLLDLNEDGRGVFLGTEAHWPQERTAWRLGAWLRNDDQSVEGSVADDEINYGVYGVFDWQADANKINLRVGLANSDGSVADRFLAAAYHRRTPSGVFGVGIADTWVTRGFAGPGRDNALDSEIYYRIPILNNAGHITPALQYVKIPDVDPQNTASASSATVASIRFHWSF